MKKLFVLLAVTFTMSQGRAQEIMNCWDGSFFYYVLKVTDSTDTLDFNLSVPAWSNLGSISIPEPSTALELSLKAPRGDGSFLGVVSGDNTCMSSPTNPRVLVCRGKAELKIVNSLTGLEFLALQDVKYNIQIDKVQTALGARTYLAARIELNDEASGLHFNETIEFPLKEDGTCSRTLAE